MSTRLTLRDRILGILRNRCTCLTSGERSDVADALCRAAEIDRAALAAERDRYCESLKQIADPRCGVFIAEDGEPGIDCETERRIAQAALDAEGRCPVPTCMDLFHSSTSCFGANNYCPRCGGTYKSYNATRDQGTATEHAHLWRRMGPTEVCVKCPARREQEKEEPR